jgi:1-acyl-sn-glycerol-3-phosphate acyltransferase
VPVTIEGSGRLMPKNTWRITPGPIRVKVGKPIDVAPFAPDDRAGLARRVREVIIAQSLALGGLGGDLENAIAAAGKEGVAERTTRPEKAA